MSVAGADEQPHRLRVPVSSDDWSRGPDDAPVTIVEYLDYECPDCHKAHPVIESLVSAQGDRVRLVARHFPLLSIHTRAMAASLAAEAAGRQGRFWQMHARLLENPGRFERQGLLEYARELGVDVERFEADMDDPELERKIRDQKLQGVRSGVNGTPTLFLNGVRYDGPVELDALSQAVSAAADQAAAAG